MKYFKSAGLILSGVVITTISVQPPLFGGETFPGRPGIENAEKYIHEREYAKAENIFLEAIKSGDPGIRREGLYGLGRVYYYLSEYEKAEVDLKAALAIHPGGEKLEENTAVSALFAGIYVYLSYVYTETAEYRKAITVLQQAENAGMVKLNKRSFLGSNIYLCIAENYLNAGDLDSARKYFTMSLELKLVDGAASVNIRQRSLLGLGKCSFFSGEFREAVEYFQRVLKNGERYEQEVCLWCGEAYLLLGEYDEGFRECSAILDDLPYGILRAKALYILATAELKRFKFKEAEKYFQEVIKEVGACKPLLSKERYNCSFYSALAHYGLGSFYLTEQNIDLDLALVEMKKACELIDSATARTFWEKVDSGYLTIAAMYDIVDILQAQGKEESAAETERKLRELILSLSPEEKTAILKKRRQLLYQTQTAGKDAF